MHLGGEGGQGPKKIYQPRNRKLKNLFFEIVILIQIRKLTWMHVHVARADHLTKRVGILSPLYSHSVTIVHFTFGILCGVPFPCMQEKVNDSCGLLKK